MRSTFLLNIFFVVHIQGDQGNGGVWEVSEGDGLSAGRFHRPAQICQGCQLSLCQQEVQGRHRGSPQAHDVQDAQHCQSMCELGLRVWMNKLQTGDSIAISWNGKRETLTSVTLHFISAVKTLGDAFSLIRNLDSLWQQNSRRLNFPNTFSTKRPTTNELSTKSPHAFCLFYFNCFRFVHSSSVRSHQTTSCVFPSCRLTVQRWRPSRRRWSWRTQSSCLHGVCVCQHAASVSRCSSWWSWHSTPCVKPLEAPHNGMLQCYSVLYQATRLVRIVKYNQSFCYCSSQCITTLLHCEKHLPAVLRCCTYVPQVSITFPSHNL